MMLHAHRGMRPASTVARRLLLLAAAFNFVAVPIIVCMARYAPTRLGLDPTTVSQRLYFDLLAWLIACFGVGYGLAAVNLPRHWPILALGAVAKAGVVVLAYAYFLSGHAATPVAVLATGDAIFSVLFVRVLATHAVVAGPEVAGGSP